MTATLSEISFSQNAVAYCIVRNSLKKSETSVLGVISGKIHSSLNSKRMKKLKNHRVKQSLKSFSKCPLLIKIPITRLMKRTRTSIRTNCPLPI
jgi:hypothetical protein